MRPKGKTFDSHPFMGSILAFDSKKIISILQESTFTSAELSAELNILRDILKKLIHSYKEVEAKYKSHGTRGEHVDMPKVELNGDGTVISNCKETRHVFTTTNTWTKSLKRRVKFLKYTRNILKDYRKNLKHASNGDLIKSEVIIYISLLNDVLTLDSFAPDFKIHPNHIGLDKKYGNDKLQNITG